MHRILIAFVAFLIATSVPAQSSAQGSLATPISIVNANKVTERLTLKGSIDTFPDVQFSPDGANLASLEIDQFSNTQDGNLYVWDAPDFKTKSQIALELGKLRAYSFNLDNQTIVTGNYHGDIGIYYRISQSQMKVGEVAAPINRIAAGGQLAAIATGYLYDTLLTLQEPQSNFAFWLWDLSNQTEFLSISKCNDENQVCIGAGIATAYSVDGRFYAFATNKGIIQIFNSESNMLLGSLGDYDYGNSKTIIFAPDNKYIIYPATDGLRLWNLDFLAHHELRNDNYRVLIKQLDVGQGRIMAASISPSGDVLAIGYSNGIIRLFNRETGEKLALLKAHTQAIYSLCFSPDGTLLASGGTDGTVRLWGVPG